MISGRVLRLSARGGRRAEAARNRSLRIVGISEGSEHTEGDSGDDLYSDESGVT